MMNLVHGQDHILQQWQAAGIEVKRRLWDPEIHPSTQLKKHDGLTHGNSLDRFSQRPPSKEDMNTGHVPRHR